MNCWRCGALLLLITCGTHDAHGSSWSIGVAPSYLSNLSADARFGAQNGGFELNIAYRFTNWWALSVGLIYGRHPSSRTNLLLAVAEAVYAIDSGWVEPYLTAGISTVVAAQASSALVVDGALHFGVGVNFHLSESWSVGFLARHHVLLKKLTDYPSFLSLHVTVRFAW